METPILDRGLLLAHADDTTRASFYRKTYLHVAIAFLVFILIEAAFLSSETIVNIGLKMTQGYTWLIVLGGFMFMTNRAEKWAMDSNSVQKQYMGFGLFILAEAFIFVPLLTIAMYFTDDPQLLTKAFMVTMGLFAGLTAVVFITKKDFSFLRTIITVGSIIALVAIAAGILFGFDLGLFFVFAMIVLAAASILYQTSNLIHRYHVGQHVAASLGLFASFMLLLWYVISFFLSRD